MTQRARNLSSALVLMVVTAFWFVESTGFRPLSRIFPRVLAAVVFVLAAILALLTLIGRGPVIKLAEGDAGARHVRSGTMIAAMVVWTGLIPLIGLLAASFIGVIGIGFLTFRAHIGTLRAIVIAVALVGAFYLLFAVLLNVPFPRGLL
jgi:putative tricarboxylic transport membrane protein